VEVVATIAGEAVAVFAPGDVAAEAVAAIAFVSAIEGVSDVISAVALATSI
jgi:hypothetical protein